MALDKPMKPDIRTFHPKRAVKSSKVKANCTKTHKAQSGSLKCTARESFLYLLEADETPTPGSYEDHMASTVLTC